MDSLADTKAKKKYYKPQNIRDQKRQKRLHFFKTIRGTYAWKNITMGTYRNEPFFKRLSAGTTPGMRVGDIRGQVISSGDSWG